jgi:hypothetical protein
MTDINVPKSDAIVHYSDEDVALLSLADAPENAIKQASQAASAIMGVIESKPKVITFNAEIYFENEDWVFIGKFYGVTVRIVTDRYVEFGTAKGFEAEAEAVLSSTGQVVGRAFMMCLDDEENWGAVPKYEWKDVLDAEGKKIWEEKIIKGKKKNLPKSEKVKVGEVKKPLFQLRSMAQTRASSKVLSMVFKFIPVLASKGGRKVSSTPADEASEDFTNTNQREAQDDKPTRAKRKAEPEATKEPEKPRDPDCITKEDQKFLYTVSTKCKLSHDEVKAKLQAEFKGKNKQPLTTSGDMLKGDLQVYLDSVDPRFHFHHPSHDAQDEPGANG